MRGRRKVFHLLFGLALALGIMLAMSLVAYADNSDPFTDGVDYIDENGVPIGTPFCCTMPV